MNAVLFNFGPVHPSTHGVLRLISILHGEIIQGITSEIGLLHRGTEKLIECNYYSSSLPYFDRFDYVSTISQELLFVHSLERLISCIGSNYSSNGRTMFLEFFRVINHCLAITTHAIDIGLFTTMLGCFEEREKLIHFIEVLSGTRFHAAYLLLGRLRYDISLRGIDSFVYGLIHFTRKLKEIHNILSMNRLGRNRLYEIGLIERDFCLYFGLSGLLSRSAKIGIDARFTGYEFYHCFDYCISLGSNKDCSDRYILRFNEIIESCRIIYAILYALLNSFFSSAISLLSSQSSSFDLMEGLISDFLIRLPFMHSFIYELKWSIESSKGIYSIFINCFPYGTTNIISNDSLIINQLNKFCRYINLGDPIAILGTIDFVLGSIDL